MVDDVSEVLLFLISQKGMIMLLDSQHLNLFGSTAA